MISWPCTPMLNSPARNATDTASPPRISGAALTNVSEIGRKIGTPPLEYSELVLKIAPRNSAEYAAEIAFHAALSVSLGCWKK